MGSSWMQAMGRRDKQHTLDSPPMLALCWATVADGGPTSNQHLCFGEVDVYTSRILRGTPSACGAALLVIARADLGPAFYDPCRTLACVACVGSGGVHTHRDLGLSRFHVLLLSCVYIWDGILSCLCGVSGRVFISPYIAHVASFARIQMAHSRQYAYVYRPINLQQQ